MSVITSDAVKEAQAQENLEKTYKDTLVFIDTCSCLHDQFSTFLVHSMVYLTRHKAKIYIPYKCVEELIKKSEDASNPGLVKKAKEALTNIMKLKEYAEVRGKSTDSFADSTILQNLLRYKEKYNLTLITQDHELAQDALALNRTGSVNSFGHTITVKKINKYGFLTLIVEDAASGLDKEQRKAVRTPTAITPFRISDQMYSGSFAYDRVTEVFKEGAVLYATDGINSIPLTVGGLVGEGGEGAVYDVSIRNGYNSSAVIKLFNNGDPGDKKPFYSRKKVELLVKSKLRNPSVCFPEMIATTASGKVVGYVMPKVKGITLHKLLMSAKTSISKAFPGATKKEMVQLCIAIITAVKYLHDRNIIIGDLQWDNIIVESPTKISIIDTDSFQLNEFTCPVGKVAFTGPERQNQAYGTYMRKLSDDLFALATIIFLIMIPGKFPYDMRGGDDVQQNIINGDFSYANGENANGLAPMGNWRFCWSHLPKELKDALYSTFRKGEKYNSPDTRLNAGQWLSIFQRYLRRIENGEIQNIDPMSMDIIPVRLKYQQGVEYARCLDCKIEYRKDILEKGHGYCPRCLDNGEEYECTECGMPLIYTRREQYKGIKKHPTCPICHEKDKQAYEYRVCPVDGKQFAITIGEYKYHTSKGLELPVRCPDCRAAGRKVVKPVRVSTPSSARPSSQSTYSRPAATQPSRSQVAAPSQKPQPKTSFFDKLKKLFGI